MIQLTRLRQTINMLPSSLRAGRQKIQWNHLLEKVTYQINKSNEGRFLFP